MRNLYMYYKRLKQYIDKREKIESQNKSSGASRPTDQSATQQPASSSLPSTPVDKAAT